MKRNVIKFYEKKKSNQFDLNNLNRTLLKTDCRTLLKVRRVKLTKLRVKFAERIKLHNLCSVHFPVSITVLWLLRKLCRSDATCNSHLKFSNCIPAHIHLSTEHILNM